MPKEISGTDTWNSFVERFRQYRRRPTWTSMSKLLPSRNGALTPRRLRKYRAGARRAIQRVDDAVERLRDAHLLPSRPSALTQARINTIVRAVRRRTFRPKLNIRPFWEAVVFECTNYTCHYCGRNAEQVWRESRKRRGLRLVVDHVRPTKRGGRDLTFKNCVAACWSCNTLKAHWPIWAFEGEIQSLTNAILARPKRSGRNGGE
jgi:5-methylcytosine-specific restriction endonuclease McrA